MSEPLSIGNEIKDGYQETYKWVSSNLKWLHDIELFYKERAKLEHEYSDKLTRLIRENLNKKAANGVALAVGETPTSTPGSVEATSMVSWNEMLIQTEQISRDHNQLAVDLENQVAGQLSSLYTKLDTTLTRINGFYEEMSERKQDTYSALEKAKRNYDEACVSMEQARNRHTKSSTEKNQKKITEKKIEMNMAKNDYLIKISQANRIKDKYFFQDIPESLDLLQDLNEVRVVFLNDIWKQANNFEVSFADKIKTRADAADVVVSQNKPSMASAMFIKHNIKQWNEPSDFTFQPSPVWHDEAQFIVKNQYEIDDLRYKLAQAEKDLDRMNQMTQNEMSILSKLNKKKHEFKANEENLNDGNEYYDILKSYLAAVSPFTNHETLKLLAEVQIESIQNNTPDDIDLSTDGVDLSKVKKKSGGSVFGKLKSGFSMPDSVPLTGGGGPHLPSGRNLTHGISTPKLSFFGSNTLHRKKSSKAPIPIPDASPARSTNNYDSDSSNDDSPVSISGRSSNHSIRHTKSNISTLSANNKMYSTANSSKVLYAYTKDDDDEVSINPGDSIDVVEKDTGSGWTKINNHSTGEIGLVPSSYLETVEAKPAKAPAPAAPPSRRTTVLIRTMVALYPYEAQGDDEMSLAVGDTIKVIKPDDGSGWTFGELNNKQSLFPTSYCKYTDAE
ncbi:hypothetical protein TBLA_0C05560 [Henningerozyma blattae CBS 6284]|uniref:Protein BZZ1 n=1 Tax=Henningerozyma blattae (strain ATCC 34711 / CBS 6284 / DSM 70876 / NBRC 10599 / NRRL Y-10934 / UCD 77-7) TaxID=1071380 RepID=I2H1V2_HENB6|nr:hypothetical protein TBLA_0C05560 [Tetrapisispora blattae CBS 6284]CCH60354.1 hypothetical protein TBLA_0C05560 [Tetrapisispora blattae CBS 6284]